LEFSAPGSARRSFTSTGGLPENEISALSVMSLWTCGRLISAAFPVQRKRQRCHRRSFQPPGAPDTPASNKYRSIALLISFRFMASPFP